MNLSLLQHFVRQDLVDKHAASAMGSLWTVLLPLANILIFTLVFSRIMGARLGDMGLDYLGPYSYSVYLIPALLAWNAFSSTVVRIAGVYQVKAGLIRKVNVSLASLPLYILVSESVVYLISMVFFGIFLWIVDFQWSPHWMWLPLIFGVQLLFAYGLGFVCAIFSVFFRDINTAIPVVMQLWFWLTPIVYVLTILPEKWAPLIRLNPLYHLVTAYRDALIMGRAPELFSLVQVAIIGAGLIVLGLYLLRHLEKDMRDFL